MWVADNWKDYELIDTSDGERLERWGKYILIRPDPQIIWKGCATSPLWKKADGIYRRSNTGGGAWIKNDLPAQWQIGYGEDLRFVLRPMGFKHTGLFPEQAANWDWFSGLIREAKAKDPDRQIKVLNLFAYTGGATMAAARAGAAVVHVDAAKGIVAQAKENAQLCVGRNVGLDEQHAFLGINACCQQTGQSTIGIFPQLCGFLTNRDGMFIGYHVDTVKFILHVSPVSDRANIISQGKLIARRLNTAEDDLLLFDGKLCHMVSTPFIVTYGIRDVYS